MWKCWALIVKLLHSMVNHHCICSLQAHNCIDIVNVSYDIMTSDHFPLSINMKLNLLPATQYNNYFIEDNTHESKYCNWSKADHKDKSLYSDMCEHLLSRLSIPNSALTCDDPNCCDAGHITDLEYLYRNIVLCLSNASSFTIPQSSKSNNHPNSVPRWSDYVKDQHDVARDQFKLWVSTGKPKQGEFFDNMKRSRARFKYALRMCKKHEIELRADSLAKHLLQKDYVIFCKDVDKHNCKKTPYIRHCKRFVWT